MEIERRNECECTLREHLEHLEEYIKSISYYARIDYYQYSRVRKGIDKRIRNIREYLSIPVNDISYGKLFDNVKKWRK